MKHRNISGALITVVSSLALCVAVVMTAGCGNKEEAASPVEAGAEAAVAESASDAVVVTVNGKTLTRGDMEDTLDRIIKSRRMDSLPTVQLASARTRLRKSVVEGFVTRALLLDEANRQAIEVDPEAVEKALGDLKAKIPPGTTFEAFLEEHRVKEEKLRNDIKEELRLSKMLEQQNTGAADPTAEEIEAFYNKEKSNFEIPESVHARHILLKCDENAEEAVKAEKAKQAEGIQKQLAGGADFAELAKQHSECPSKDAGGDLGSFPRGRMVKEFEDAAFTQKTNEIGPVVETKFGYHVIEVLEHEPPGTKPLDQVREEIASFLNKSRRRDAFQVYVTTLKEKADITYGDQM